MLLILLLIFLNSNLFRAYIFFDTMKECLFDATTHQVFFLYFLRSSFHFYSSKQTSTNEGFVHWEVIYCRYIAMTVAHFPIVIRPVWHANVFNIKDFRKSERIYSYLRWIELIHFLVAIVSSSRHIQWRL